MPKKSMPSADEWQFKTYSSRGVLSVAKAFAKTARVKLHVRTQARVFSPFIVCKYPLLLLCAGARWARTWAGHVTR